MALVLLVLKDTHFEFDIPVRLKQIVSFFSSFHIFLQALPTPINSFTPIFTRGNELYCQLYYPDM